eukprot:TRINITY_DN2649_c0_g1_i13.p6 TRINITY_DN2649_c0_g1~~TRINITY_DN2649_c0_g1_i13.p6  ORF type:complete len:140 (-),score=2.32 TRINITY_DN2649_c0_g1_i13:308-727(-)
MHFMLCCSCVCSFNLKKLFLCKVTCYFNSNAFVGKQSGRWNVSAIQGYYFLQELQNDSQQLSWMIYENYCITDIDIINNSTSYIQNVKSLFVCIVYILIKISLCCYIPGKKQCKEIYWAKKVSGRGEPLQKIMSLLLVD